MELMTKYRNLYQASINAIAEKTVAEIIDIGHWKSSSETFRFETAADIVQHKVMTGQCQIIDYAEAMERWKAAGVK